jgi:DNA polymerase-1
MILPPKPARPNRYTTTPEAYALLHEGILALSEVEATGVRVDKSYLDAALVKTERQIRVLEEEIKSDPNYRIWQRRYGEKTNLGAPEQLAGVVGYKPRAYTTGGAEGRGKKRGKADESSFEGIDLPLVQKYFKVQKLRKGRGTYLIGIQREMVEENGMWFVHPSYALNRVATHRSSCSSPNWQNIPSRSKMLAEMVRRCYIPLPGYQLIEIDFSQVEVRVAACYSHDPVLIKYINDPKSDMHRDMAAKLFFLNEKQAAQKDIRHLAKNKMVFPQFYGDFYPRCAKNIWDAIGFQNIKVGQDGPSLYKHLAANGISECGDCDPDNRPVKGTFEQHVKEIEEWMWGRWLKVYAEWKKRFYAEYLKTGGFQMFTGFAINGHYAKNEVVNSPIQGSAFHCLLWALPRIVRHLRKHKFRSRVVGEIHDNLVGCVHPRERDDYIQVCRRFMVEEIAKAWPWLIVPLEVEIEACPIDKSWYDKAVLVQDEDTDLWAPKDKDRWTERYGDWSLQLAT